MSFEVINPGILTLLQDAGRYGYQHLGVTTGGPMDEHAFAWANHLLGNAAGSAQLEITYGLLQLRCLADTCIALTGADLGARINGEPLAPWSTRRVRKGDEIAFATPLSGLRAYLAVLGGFQAEVRLGSCATVCREGLGGGDGAGGKLRAGDILRFEPSRALIEARVPAWAIPDYDRPLALGVMAGYQHDEFDIVQRTKFYSASYKVSQNIDRMGYRLSGDAIAPARNGIISEGIAFGAIQIPSDGQPIVLLRDRQTIGGYPKIGCISALGAAQLAQRGPGSQVHFHPMDVCEAEAQRMIFNHRLCL
ncbi:biotin-dependent carboxyltransferase family protein [Marinobacterium rhizophilum]|uniref:Biotin-dependent carboxyltransferase n=1 Tax=Marinobacterium rhizophilum TaxID=420402 RepID=A0ABY5HSN4_9GAMM|nr:biotin-dependent carboxyltransferase family protein [Marinobacterium rhizophilum]UTW14209.1 biotin-dependent carboxyltransferase [Marinobacterium rhizophilum]